MAKRSSSDEDQVDYDAPTDTYRPEDYEDLPKPVERPTGEAGPSMTEQHRSGDYDEIMASAEKVTSTVTDKAETKVVTPGDSGVGTK